MYSGPIQDATPYVDIFQKLSPVYLDEKVVSWNALPWATYNGLNNILCTEVGWKRFPIKNFYAANAKHYDIPTMRTFFDSWREMNERYDGEALFSVMFESFPQQAVQAKDEDATAYPWRHGSHHFLQVPTQLPHSTFDSETPAKPKANAPLTLRMAEVGYKTPENEAIFDTWLSKQQDAWIETSGYGRLQQYINYGHGSKDPPQALYGYEPWRLEKLRAVKAELDPEGWFNGYQPFMETPTS